MCRAADPVVQRLRRLRRKSEPDANERLGFVQSDTVEPVGGDDGFATKPAVQGRVMPGAGGRAPDALNEPSEAFGALCDSLHQEQERAPEDLGTNWDPGADAPALPPQEGRGAKAIERRESERSASDLPSCQQDASLRSASDRLTWQQEFLAEGLEIERPRFPSVEEIAGWLGGHTRVERIPTPWDCVDGFFEAFWRRPEALLDPVIRASQSIWTLLAPGVEERIVTRLADALRSGRWDAEHGHLRRRESYDGALRLVISETS